MVLTKEEATSDKARDHVTHGGVPRAGCRGLTTGECAVKRLSPQPVVTFRPLVMEKTSYRHQGQPGTGDTNPDLTLSHDGPQPVSIRTEPHTGRSACPSSWSFVPSRKEPSRQAGIKSILSTPLARGGAERCCAETSRTQFVTSTIGPVTVFRRGPSAASIPPEITLGFANANLRPYFSSSLTLSIRGAVSPARHVLTRPRPHPVFRQEREVISGAVFVKDCDDVPCPVRQSLS